MLFKSNLPLTLLTPTSPFESFRIFNIPLSATAVAIHRKRLMAICSNTLKVFSFDSNMSLRPIHTYNMSYTLAACAYLPSSVLTLVAKILLNLINDSVELSEAEVALSRIMNSLKLDTVRKVNFFNNSIGLHYRDGSCRWFNGEMNEITEKTKTDSLVIKRRKNYVSVWLDTVLLLNRRFGHVSNALCHGNLIILKKSDSLIVIVDKM